MPALPIVTVVGATGAQGGAVVRALVKTGKYKIRGLTRDPASEKAQTLQQLSNDIEVVKCDVTKSDDVQRAFKDSWAVFAVTDFWAQPDKPEVEVQQGTVMADAAALLQIPYYIYSTTEDMPEQIKDKLKVPYVTQKAMISDYIKKTYPNLKTIFVELGFHMQNWINYAKVFKLDDGTIVFPLPVDPKAELHMVNVDDLGPLIREILESPMKFVGQHIRVCGEEISFDDISKTFTKFTGIPALSKTLTSEEFRASISWLPKSAQDDLSDMYKWIEEYGLRRKDKDWTNGQKITKLSTFEEWLKTTGWKGE